MTVDVGDPVADRPARRSGAETRLTILQAAHELFYWHGIRATGVDAVAAAAGVAPTSLYRLFGSKDGLITAYVDQAADGYRQRMQSALDAADPAPEAQIRALFDAVVDETRPEDCRGCLFQIAIAETPDPAHPAHQAALACKQWMRDQLARLAHAHRTGRGRGDSADLADLLWLLMEGAYASSTTDSNAASRARALVDFALTETVHT